MRNLLTPSKIAAAVIYIVFVFIFTKVLQYFWDSPTAFLDPAVFALIWGAVGMFYFIPKLSNYLIDKGILRR